MSVLDAEQGADVVRTYRLDLARTLLYRACELGDARACVDRGRDQEACRLGDAPACVRADAEHPDDFDWLAERCAAGSSSACALVSGGGVASVRALPPACVTGGSCRTDTVILADGALFAFVDGQPRMWG
ncbi:MAG: hypothetical protein ABMB14_31170, partial [Myxococcota bacterium]